jgi:hypothetical protein
MFAEDLECPVTTVSLFQDSSDTSLEKRLSEIVTIDPKSFLIDIKNNVKTSKTFEFVIKVANMGDAIAYKTVQIVYDIPVPVAEEVADTAADEEPVPIPKFKSKLQNAKVSISDQSFSYASPEILLQGDEKYKLVVKGEKNVNC